jgi:hypothetical protein
MRAEQASPSKITTKPEPLIATSCCGRVLTNYHVVADCKDIRDIRMRVPGAPEDSAKLVAFNVAISKAVINAGDVIDIGTAHLDSNGTFGAFGELKKSGRATASAGCRDW